MCINKWLHFFTHTGCTSHINFSLLFMQTLLNGINADVNIVYIQYVYNCSNHIFPIFLRHCILPRETICWNVICLIFMWLSITFYILQDMHRDVLLLMSVVHVARFIQFPLHVCTFIYHLSIYKKKFSWFISNLSCV